ncbi:hypothetical protein BAY61_21735 [Prauserella marina]|uniref:Pycsar effector protein domain-containing protein n=1 Tax=Prauserella marina TaxID=530584 RepID=A0A222VTH5_9PSEU|nr:Pycsar system effector family protein [Prauserella marina]ASR37180.1 hypothetical protein BAY61_21735 [Prauserella marina]PWV72492.1 hypothetical protein DES30_11091 [Prauserella marina]SDD78750.1 hypothetical protein SAMN05421630_112147 [Prauserella marina]
MTKSDDAWKALSQINDLIKVADAKAGVVLASAGVLGGIVVRAVPSPTQWRESWFHTGLLLLSIALVSVSILLSLRAFVPRLRTGGSRSLLHFDNIARRYTTAADFSTACRALFEQHERLQDAVITQLWATSKIARRKFRSVTCAIISLGFALLTALAAGVLGN